MSRLSILLVDDEVKVVEYLDGIFFNDEELHKHKIYTASDFNQAIKFVSKNRIDICITDIVLPEKSGIFLAKEISKISRNTKIIFISGNKSQKDAEAEIDFETHNVVAFLEKPLDKEKILSLVKSLI